MQHKPDAPKEQGKVTTVTHQKWKALHGEILGEGIVHIKSLKW